MKLIVIFPGIDFVLLSGAIAQLGERLPCTQEVGSSILPGSTRHQWLDEHQALRRLARVTASDHLECFMLMERAQIFKKTVRS